MTGRLPPSLPARPAADPLPDWLRAIERWPAAARVVVTVAMVAVITWGDYLTGAEVAFTALYLVPIALAAWSGSRPWSVLAAVSCSLSWVAVELATRPLTHPLPVTAWNFVVQLVVFGGAALLVHGLRWALVEERQALIAEHERRLAAQTQLRHAERLVTVGRLASGVAHELGTPLNVAQNYAQMIESGTVEGDERVEGAKIIREQVEGMTRIVRQLLDFARAGKPQRSAVDLVEVVGAALAMLKPIARQKQVQLELAAPPSLTANADGAQLQQVLTNLVVNAVQAVPSGGKVRVEVEARAAGQAMIRVSDDGPGVAAEILPHLFEPFVTTKQVGEGTGLGLAVAYGIAREHGGELTAENLAQGGACFTLLLPVDREAR